MADVLVLVERDDKKLQVFQTFSSVVTNKNRCMQNLVIHRIMTTHSREGPIRRLAVPTMILGSSSTVSVVHQDKTPASYKWQIC